MEKQPWFLQKKKAVGALFMATLIFCMNMLSLGGLAQEDSPYPFNETTNEEKVNMRRSASSTSVVLERIVEEGTPVTVLGDQGEYYKISYNDRIGFVLKKYIGSGNPIQGGGTLVSDYPYTTTAKEKVRLRARASTSSTILAYIEQGATLTVKSKEGQFVKVDYNGTGGYVMGEYVNLLFVEDEGERTAEKLAVQAEYTYIDLSQGSEGAEVRSLQYALTELGFLNEEEVDGIYGKGTKVAVEQLQKKNDLKATGVADQALQALLYENKPKNYKGNGVKVKTLPPVFGATMRLNNKGEAVASLQQRLIELGFKVGEVNGVYDKQTSNAIKDFQKKNGLNVDGLAGYQTQSLLFSGEALPIVAQPSPTPGPIPKAPKNPVKKGDQGEDAEKVQKRLSDLGYYQGVIDGNFGTSSVEALQRFQSENYMEADGIAGKETLKLLFSSKVIGYDVATLPEPTYPPITKENVIVVQSGIAGEVVARLQNRLTELGYYISRNDGKYLAEDVNAVKAFQRNNGLKDDGKAGYETQVLLYSANAIPSQTGQLTGQGEEGVDPGLNTNITLRQGDTGAQVMALQNRLIELGYLASGEADGRYGLKTAEAVVGFQRANNLVRDGVAGSATLQKVYDTAITPLPQATQTPSPGILTKGDVSDGVRSIQEKLIKLGYLTGTADGVFGIQTELALKNFQLRNGISADGIVGNQTLGMIDNTGVKPAEGMEIIPQTTPTPNITDGMLIIGTPKAAQVIYGNWYDTVRAKVRANPMLTVYDFATGLNWRVNAFSNGAHSDAETLTAQDTANMLKAFGGEQTWTPKPVWVVLSDGTVFMASTHSTGHDVDHTPGNNIAGHICIHFPRTLSQVQAIGPYATSHQLTIDEGWLATQKMIR